MSSMDTICQDDKLILGYIKSMHHSANQPIIIRLIAQYYHNGYSFNHSIYGKNLLFSANTVKHGGSSNNWSTCIFGPTLNAQTCNQFDVEIAWRHKGDAFVMGFVTQRAEQSIKSWNTHHIGFGANKLHSVGIRVNERYNNLYLYDRKYVGKKLKYHTPTLIGFQPDDLFLLSFDFKSYRLRIYHNGSKADIVSLDEYKSMDLTLAFSLKCPRSQIDVIKCKMS